VPLPAPGDAAIAYGVLPDETGAIPYPLAYLAVISGAVLGSACNLDLTDVTAAIHPTLRPIYRADRSQA